MAKHITFTADGDRRFLFALGESKWPWQDYSSGYSWAAFVLMDFVRNDPKERIIMSYPILYLLRHSIELQLKELHYFAQSYYHKQEPVPTGHKLAHLWNSVKPFVDMVFLQGDGVKFFPINSENQKEYDAYIQTIRSVVEELDDIDMASTTFRYPFNKDGSNSFLGSSFINLETSFERVHTITDYLHLFLNYIVEMMGPKFPSEAA